MTNFLKTMPLLASMLMAGGCSDESAWSYRTPNDGQIKAVASAVSTGDSGDARIEIGCMFPELDEAGYVYAKLILPMPHEKKVARDAVLSATDDSSGFGKLFALGALAEMFKAISIKHRVGNGRIVSSSWSASRGSAFSDDTIEVSMDGADPYPGTRYWSTTGTPPLNLAKSLVERDSSMAVFQAKELGTFRFQLAGAHETIKQTMDACGRRS